MNGRSALRLESEAVDVNPDRSRAAVVEEQLSAQVFRCDAGRFHFEIPFEFEPDAFPGFRFAVDRQNGGGLAGPVAVRQDEP